MALVFRGIGGRTALDYLVFVKGISFAQAVLHLTGTEINRCICSRPPLGKSVIGPAPLPVFRPPEPFIKNKRVILYLMSRGIDRSIIGYCIETGILYEDAMTHAVVFLGKDIEGHPRHAMLRGIEPDGGFKKDTPGSDKRYCFSIPGNSHELIVCESPIDTLSYGTLEKRTGRDWRQVHYLSLCGVSPLALEQYLKDHSVIRDIALCLDNDAPGREAAIKLMMVFSSEGYVVHDNSPINGKDYNEYLGRV